MRLKPRVWFLISLLLFAGAVCTWQYAEKRAALRNPAPAAKVSALPPHQPPAVKTAAAKPINKHKSYRISNTTQTVAQLLRNNHALILRNALIDTEVPVGLDIPAHLRAKGAPGSYLVQADRPLDKAFYAELSKSGASYISYIPNNAALVQATPAQATNLAANADVIVVLPYEPYYKLDATLLPSAVEQQIQTNVLNVTTFPGQRDAALAALTQLGAKLLGEDSGPFGPTLTVRVPPDSLAAVAQLPLAQEIEVSSPRRLLNDLARVQMGESTNTLLGTPTYLGLSGLNVTVNINDTGVDGTHPDLMGRLVPDPNNFGTTNDYSGHGTHVAGIIAGSGLKSTTVTYPIPGSTNNADFRGKATNATLFVQYYNNSSDAYLQTNASTNLGPTNFISNNSWGYANSTVYDMHAASYDAATRDALPNSPHGGQPLLFVFAAGDGGNGSGTITSPGTAKNVITVGASDEPRNITNKVTYDGNLADGTEIWLGQTENSNTVAPFSSSGNIDIGVEGTYGRFKPDVVAPGVFTISCRATNYVDPTNEAYVTDNSYQNQTVAMGQTNYYGLYIPGDTSQVIAVISSNITSPKPFPNNMLIVDDPIELTYPPTNVASTNNYFALTNYIPGDIWVFGVAPPTNGSQTQAAAINYNFDIYLSETNNTLTNYFYVLSNLNSVLKPYYMYQSGTSMAAGAVSGTLALMQEFLQTRMSISNPSPALLKAMLINGSRTLSSAYDFNVNPLNPNEQGWGVPNITNCLPASLTNANSSMMLIDQSTNNALATDQYQTYTITCTDSNAISNVVRITLVWTDPPGDPAAGIALVNNLELTVVDSAGSNFIGNNFLSGDIYTQASNPTNPPAGDLVNNVQNVYISPTNGPNKTINFPLTVTISAPRVNVNAVTTQTTNILQDYALVISSDHQTLSNSFTNTTSVILTTNVPVLTVVSNGQPLLHQRVGANEPNLYSYPSSTNGYSNQWHFFVYTNNQISATNDATNVAFATFLPPNLSIPRSTSADIDLYVYTNIPAVNPLTDFSLFVSGSIKSVGRTGTESIVISNSSAGQVYYIGVKSEDQQGADFGLYAVAQQEPFSSQNSDGSITATANTTPPILIPDATSPQPALAFAFMVNPNPLEPNIRRATVSLGIAQPNPYDLYGTVQFSGVYTVINAYTSAETGGITNVYDDLQEDPNSGTVVTDGYADGTGGLNQYAGLNANGLWLLTEADKAIGQTGDITSYSVTVDPQPPQLGGFIISNLCGGTWYNSYIDVPNDATNLTLTATFIGGAGNIGIYLTNFDNLSTSDYGSNNNAANGVIVTLGTNNPVPGWSNAPPLSGGRWYYGIYNYAPPESDCLTLAITNYIQESLTPNLTQTYTNNTNISLTTDGHTQSEICLTNVAAGTQVVSLQIGVLIEDTNLDDLVIHLISPQGTEVNLFEDRGGPTATNLGLIQTNGGYIYTIFTENTNQATTPIKFAPPPFAYMSVVPTNILWSDSFETSTNGVYTNGQIVGSGWLVTNDEVTIMTTNGPTLLTNDEVGIVTDPNGDQYIVTNVVGVTTNVVTNSLGTNYLALTSGHIIQTFGVTNTFGITNGQPYQLVFYAKPMGIIDWWPADDDADDIINSTNDGIAALSPFGLPSSPTVSYDVGEVARAFTFNGSSNKVTFGTNVAAFGTNDFTIDFWMNTTLATNTFVSLLEKGSGGNFQSNYFGILLRGSNIYYLQSSNIISSHAFQLSSTNSVNITNGVYHHLAVTRQGLATNISLISIYIDGTNITAGTNTEDSVISNTTPLVAGYDSTFLPFAGELDELDLCNRALSPAEVYAIFYAGNNGKYNTNSLLPNFQLTIDGIATNTVTLTNWSGGWELITNSFTANSDQITVEFSGNTMGVLLDDIQLIQEPATNYNNYFLPEEPLTPFVGENPLGCWTLDVWDTRNDSPLPTNGTLVSWNLQVTTSSTNATLYVLATNGYTLTITNAQSNGMTYFAVDVPSYATYATNILTVSNVVGAGPYTLYFDQTNLPTGGLPGDVALTNGATGPSTNVLASLGSPPPLLPGQRYFLGVLNTGGTIGAFNITVNFNVAATNGITTLSNTIPTNNSIIIGTNGASTPEYYVFVVPTNAVQVTFQILNATNGEVDLYAHDGLPLPGPADFDYASRNAGTNSGTNDQFITVTTTSVPVALPVASTNNAVPLTPSIWYLAAYNEITNTTTNANPVTNNYTIVATYVTSNQLTIIPLTNGMPFYTPASGLPNFTYAPPGYPTNVLYSYTDTNLTNAALQFTVTNLSGVGNVDLLAGLDIIPTPQDFYIGSFNSGTNAQLIQLLGTNATVTNAISGTWYLVVPNTSGSNVSYSIEALEIGTGTYTTNAPAIFSAAVAPATGKFTMSWSANPGQTYEVDMSTNLPNWTFLTNVTAQSTTATYTDPTPISSQSLRFYRVQK